MQINKETNVITLIATISPEIEIQIHLFQLRIELGATGSWSAHANYEATQSYTAMETIIESHTFLMFLLFLSKMHKYL